MVQNPGLRQCSEGALPLRFDGGRGGDAVCNRLFLQDVTKNNRVADKKGREDRPESHLRRSDHMTMISVDKAGGVPACRCVAALCVDILKRFASA